MGNLRLIPLIHVLFPELIDVKGLNAEITILAKDTTEFAIKMDVILLLTVMEIKITGAKVLDLLLILKPKKLLSLLNLLLMMVPIMVIWSKSDGFTELTVKNFKILRPLLILLLVWIPLLMNFVKKAKLYLMMLMITL